MYRILASALFVVLLVGSAGLSCAGDDRHTSPLGTAERLEREGRQMLEAGRKADGAQLLSKAWAIRAEVFRDEARRGAKEDELARATAEAARAKRAVTGEQELEIRRRVAELVAASNEAERRGKEARAAGREEDAARAMEESGRLWREADALKAKLAAVLAARDAATPPPASPGVDELRAQVAELRQVVDALRKRLDELAR